MSAMECAVYNQLDKLTEEEVLQIYKERMSRNTLKHILEKESKKTLLSYVGLDFKILSLEDKEYLFSFKGKIAYDSMSLSTRLGHIYFPYYSFEDLNVKDRWAMCFNYELDIEIKISRRT